VNLSRGLLRIRRSARAFARAPGLSFVLILTIAVGVGSDAAVYGFLQGLTHHTPPIGGAEPVVSIFKRDRSLAAGPLSPGDFQLVANTRGAFAWVGAAQIKPGAITIHGHAVTANVATVTSSVAEACALPLDKNGAMISHRLWESELSSSKEAVGSHIRIDGADFSINGIAPVRLDGLYNDQRVDLWIPSEGQDLEAGNPDRRDLWVLGRLRRGISLTQAQTALRSGSLRLPDVYLAPFTGIAPNSASGLARVGLFLGFSAAAVFFICCINVATFLLGRALRRSHETSLRIALGATRAELLRDLFADSVVISIAGGLMGVLLGILTAHALPALLFEEDAQRLSFAPHLLPIITASIVCVVLTVICGMMPVLGTVTDRPWMVLQRAPSSPSKAIQRLRSALVIAQIAICCMLVLFTSLLLDGLHAALKTTAGHRLGNPVLLTVQAMANPAVDTNYFSDVERRAKSVASLTPMAWTARLPGTEPMWRSFRIQQRSQRYRGAAMDIVWLRPDSELLGRPLIAGRMFGLNDQRYRVAIVNEAAAQQLFGRETVGVVIEDPSDLPVEIIGVIRETPEDANQQAHPTIYYGGIGLSAAPSPIRNAHFRVPVVPPIAGVELSTDAVSAQYFDALGMRLIAGRGFPEGRGFGQERVAVINQEAADLYFNGKPISAGVIDDEGVRSEVIGVVSSQTFGTFEQHAEPTIYMLMWQDCPPRMTLMLRDSQWNSGIAADLREAIESMPGGGSGPIAVSTLDAQLARSGLAPLRIATLIGSVSAATALVLSILGLLSAQTDAERRRQRDRALRIALGAQRWRIVFLVVNNAGRLAFAGIVAGTFLSFLLFRLLVAGIPGVTSPPVAVWLIAPLLPAALVVVASVIPAQRASVISPSTIMREG